MTICSYLTRVNRVSWIVTESSSVTILTPTLYTIQRLTEVKKREETYVRKTVRLDITEERLKPGLVILLHFHRHTSKTRIRNSSELINTKKRLSRRQRDLIRTRIDDLLLSVCLVSSRLVEVNGPVVS